MADTTTKQRNVYTIAERKDDLIAGIESMEELSRDKVINLINSIMTTKGNGQSDYPADKVVDGTTYKYCIRSGKWFTEDNMVSGKTYSKESQKALTDANREVKSLQKEVTDLTLAGDVEKALKTAQTLKALKEEIDSNIIYSHIEGDLKE